VARTGKLTLDDLVAQLRSAFGDTLRAVVLYGSAASGEAVPGRSDQNVLLVADRLPMATLRQLGQTMRAWQEAGNPPVLCLTTEEWQGSADIFPMEYADILERHRVLDGVLPLDGVRVSLADLRLQVEQEAMGKLLRLRRAVMTAGTDAERQRELLRASLSALLVLFRGVLRLRGVEPPRDAAQVIRAVAAACAFDAGPFLAVVALRAGTSLDTEATDRALTGYLQGMEALVGWLDAHTPSPGVDVQGA